MKLAFGIAPDVPETLIGDELRLGRILANLGDNAVKFNDPGGEITAAVSLKDEDDESARLHFSVRDTEIGIAPEQRGKPFHAFTQVDGSSSRKYGGTGLGLVLSKKLTESMDGEIWMESEYGAGSTFPFTVRLKKP